MDNRERIITKSDATVYYYGSSVDSWPLMGSPICLVIIITVYLYFILKLGPQLMSKRAPFDLKYALMLYNAYQVVFSTWLVFHVLIVDDSLKVIQYCRYLNQTQADIGAQYTWYFFISKVVELLDTVFFVLRKKQAQVTFLHVYHHVVTLTYVWIFLKYFENGHGVFMGSLNSVVHIVMYSYYFVAGLGPEYRKFLWWKKYVTWLQLIQFVAGAFFITYMVMGHNQLPTPLILFYIFNCGFFIYLFADFYIRAYYKSHHELSTKPDKTPID